jgi:hypothetical protein
MGDQLTTKCLLKDFGELLLYPIWRNDFGNRLRIRLQEGDQNAKALEMAVRNLLYSSCGCPFPYPKIYKDYFRNGDCIKRVEKCHLQKNRECVEDWDEEIIDCWVKYYQEEACK